MKQGYLLPVLAMLSVAALLAATACTALPVCTEADTAGLPQPRNFSWRGDGEVLTPAKDKAQSERQSRILAAIQDRKKDSLEFLFDTPTLKYPFGSLDIYGFDLTFIVSEEGRVACASVKPAYRASGPKINYVREAFLQTVSDWRFKPYLIDGKPSRVAASLKIDEEELPRAHVAMPAGNPADVTITQDMRPWLASFGPYHVELHGDGTAIYTSGDRDDPLGPQTYHVDAKAVQDLLKKAKALDFWSLRDQYRSPNANDDGRRTLDRVNITLGGKTKSLTLGNNLSGMPEAARTFSMAVLGVARIDFWQVPTLATLDQLKANDYDFQSRAGGRLLLQMTQHPNVKDDAILALMQLGAPQDARGGNDYMDGEYQSLIEAALGAGRVEVAKPLIANGALQTSGETDQDKVDWAFYNAVSSGKLPPVELMLPFHPAMTYTDYDADDHEVQVSVIRRLGNHCYRFDDPIPVAKRLLELGANVNASEADGRTLLHLCDSNVEFIRFLLDHGADIEAVDEDDTTPLGATYDEDVALLLLERGANPRQETAAKHLRFNIEGNDWRRVKAWLLSHGFADVLVAPPGEGKQKRVEAPHV